MNKKKICRKKISKECWNLNTVFFQWLKERLPVYLKEADKVIDLNYHKFIVDGKEFTQKEVIQMMITDLNFITNVNTEDWSGIYYDKVNHLMQCWSKVILAMWW